MNDEYSFKPAESFADSVNIQFDDLGLLERAFTHRSYVNENRGQKIKHNERLEFLGDAVLELVITEYLFAKYPNKPEGELTAVRSALVNTVSISEAATELNMNDYLRLSRGEAKDIGRARQYILANTFESVIGAIYLDQGYSTAKVFIGNALFSKTDEIVEKKLWQDAKSGFQESAQEHVGITPSYKTLSAEGPDHDKEFTVGVYLKDELVAEGSGKSKQEAQQEAAKAAWEKKGW
jgi:ribonuclease-3